ncbi:patatin-like phospholipase family protein [Vibrio astriarenae]|uniref:patatin-like phospholipase family protein n=1 Tax=Vibrio astriarenae TaxID=1481923 RepID=UPI003735CFC6
MRKNFARLFEAMWEKSIKVGVAVIVLLIVSGCTSTPQRNTSELSEGFKPLNIEHARFWDGDNTNLAGYDFLREYETLLLHKPADEPVRYLALSGGGVNGAFAAGILNAWSDTGQRPDFDVISGISTGAIVSVFAYLGESYDEALKSYYTETTLDEMFKRNSFLSMVSRNAIVDVSGFEKKVRDAVDQDMLSALAAERDKGRLLLIGTTNLDYEKLALWDIGRIAKHGSPESMELIQDIIIASSSIPGLFPAKLINVYDGEHQLDELHVDGGVSRQVFFAPQWIRKTIVEEERGQEVYVIRNGRLRPTYRVIDYDLATISARSLSSLTRNQGVGDVDFIYYFCRHNSIDFMLAHIDSDFEYFAEDEEPLEYMRWLYEYGYSKVINNDAWSDIPPSMEPMLN